MQKDLIKIDGSFGEGGGQILRTSLSLSAITKTPFEIYNIRANRKTPGLSYQHLQAVNAASQICSAEVIGNQLRSTDLKFFPGDIQAGTYHLNIGTAGSISLVLQTIFYLLSLVNNPSSVTITGGTHVIYSPCIDYLIQQWLYYVRQIGFHADILLLKAGFYPRGGGEVLLNISPATPRYPLRVVDRGKLIQVKGISMVSNLDINIAHRQQMQAKKRLSECGIPHEIVVEERTSPGKGTMLMLIGKFEHSQCCYFSLGAIGKRAETVADEACSELLSFMKTRGVIDEYLADQLIIPLALTEGSSQFITPKVTQHLLTNIEVVKRFLPITIEVSGNLDEEGTIKIKSMARDKKS